MANEFIKYDDGSTYMGGFVNGKRHGYGKMIYKDGSIKEDRWENSEFKG